MYLFFYDHSLQFRTRLHQHGHYEKHTSFATGVEIVQASEPQFQYETSSEGNFNENYAFISTFINFLKTFMNF